ncbi:MAG TPA: carboxymuconolactone decarboxylase family protein [Longimicrobiales bacterium]|nr:carboxymuconolactone decarboxylase family protein [Longimicrobiales bacterium]
MDERTRALVRLSAALTGREGDLPGVMDDAAAAAPREAEEVLLQSYLFLGFPVALNAFGLWRRRTGRAGPRDGGEEDAAGVAWLAHGEEVCRAVYGGQYEALRHLMAGLHPALDRWAVAEGYGKVLGRDALDLPTRELCIAALLAGTTASRQLHAHLRGCLNVGVGPERVDAMLDAVSDLLPAGRAEEAGRVWQRVRARWAERTEG